MKQLFGSLLYCLLLSANCNDGPSSDTSRLAAPGIRVVKEGLEYPWEILWGKDGQIWMTERDGAISRIDPATGNTTFSFTIPEVRSRNEGGMLGLALDPNFSDNGYLYVVYDYENGRDYKEKLVRYTFHQQSLTNPTVLIDGIEAAGIHNGSRLWITDGPDPKIFMTTGDASRQGLPQQTKTLNGKVLRLNLDGSVPADNPFPDNPVWSYGHRNPQGLVMANGILYSSEHGATTEDEVNIIEKARNYGWPEVEGPCDGHELEFCHLHRVKEPVWSSGDHTLAVCGLDYYNHDRIPQWKNSLLMLTLKNASIEQLQLSADGHSIVRTKSWFKGRFGRLRDCCISPDGKLYICTSNGGKRDVLVEISSL